MRRLRTSMPLHRQLVRGGDAHIRNRHRWDERGSQPSSCADSSEHQVFDDQWTSARWPTE